MEPSSSTGLATAAAIKLKFWLLIPAILGAAIMLATKPPKERKTMFLYAFVAISSSFLFGHQLAHALDYYVPWVDLTTHADEHHLDYMIAVHGLVGAAAWSVCGLAHTAYAKLREDPAGALRDFWNIVTRRRG